MHSARKKRGDGDEDSARDQTAIADMANRLRSLVAVLEMAASTLGLSAKLLILSATGLGATLAIGIAIFLHQGGHRPSDEIASGATQAPVRPPRPALSPDEERYIRALWPIHGDVERNTMRVSLGQIFYKTQDLGRGELRARVEQALIAYKGAEKQIKALEPPASLRAQHEGYLDAVRLFQESASEIMMMFKDGRDDHLIVAYPKGQAGTDKIREIGGKFWPNEFPPH